MTSLSDEARQELIDAEIALHDQAEAAGEYWVAKRSGPLKRAWLELQYRFWRGFYRSHPPKVEPPQPKRRHDPADHHCVGGVKGDRFPF